MATLAGHVSAIQTAVAGVSGIKHAPEYPPEQAGDFPFVVVYPATFRGQTHTADDFRMLYDVRVELHLSRSDIPTACEVLYPYAESVPNAIFGATRDSLIAQDGIEGTFGALEWNGAPTIGFVWTVRGLKVITNIT